MNELAQFKQTYITECFELLADMEAHLLALDIDNINNEQLNAIFRCAHSIKGGSGAFGLDYITNFTHVLEALLDSMREGKIPPTRKAIDALLRAVDVVTQMVKAAANDTRPHKDLGAELMVELQKLANLQIEEKKLEIDDDKIDTKSEILYKIDFKPHEELFATGNEPLLIIGELSALGNAKVTADIIRVPSIDEINPLTSYLSWQIELLTSKSLNSVKEVFEFVSDVCDLKIEEIEQKKNEITKENTQQIHIEENTAKTTNNNTTSIRVDLEKVDRLVNMVGELVITEAMLKAQTRNLPVEQFPALIRGIEELSQHTRELQEAVMSVRMQPVKSVFSRMPRIVRDLSAELGKDIKLITSGENTEVDKTVIEQLGDPLTHMIRNSVDHGIESPEERRKKGKNEQGTIILSAEHRGGRIIIEIRDDGAGINCERVIAKAKEKGIIAKDATLSEDEAFKLIFAAGFSTAAVISNVSGRGVGMDVVKRNIEALGGVVGVKSEFGKGSLFTVSLPLTLAILDGMIVRVGAETYIIPITSIIETLRPKSEEVRRVEGHRDVINVRGEFISVIYVNRIFNIKNAENDPSKALVVLVESGGNKFGLVVDELIGQQQVVIKSLETNSDPVKGISGATILGDGRVSLILEISQLAQLEDNHSKIAIAA